MPVHFGSGTRKVTLLRPPGTYAVLRAKEGLTSLSLDGEWVGTLASTDWRSPGPEGAAGGYEISLAAGSSRLTIAYARAHTLAPPAPAPPAGPSARPDPAPQTR